MKLFDIVLASLGAVLIASAIKPEINYILLGLVGIEMILAAGFLIGLRIEKKVDE